MDISYSSDKYLIFILLVTIFIGGNHTLLGQKQWQDTAKAKVWLEKSKKISYQNIDSANAYIQLAKEIYLRLEDEKGLLNVDIAAVWTTYLVGKYDSAYRLSISSYKKATKENWKREKMLICNNLGTLFTTRGIYDTAIYYQLQALEIAGELKENRLIAGISGNLGSIFQQAGDTSKAYQYLQKAYQLNLANADTLRAAYALINLGILYKKQKKYLEAENALKEANEIGKKKKDLEVVFASHLNIGEVYLVQSKQVLAQQQLQFAYEIAQKLQSNDKIATALSSMANGAIAQKDYATAESYLHKALNISQKNPNAKRRLDVMHAMYEVQKKLGNDKGALQYHLMYAALNDSLNKLEMKKNLQELEVKYQTEKKEKEIIQKNLEIKNKNQWLLLLTISGLAAVALIVLITINSKRKQILLQQKNTLLQQAQDLGVLKAMAEGEENERKRIAKELHDGVCGMLATASLYVNSAQKDAQNVTQSEKITQLLTQAHQEVRTISHNLMPSVLEKSTLSAAVAGMCEELANAKGIHFVFQLYGEEKRLPMPAQTHIYRCMQELMQNVVKHADAKNVLLEMVYTPHLLSMTFEDDGKGWNKLQTNKGIGLENIRNRIQLLKGEIEIDTQINKGTSFYINIPLI